MLAKSIFVIRNAKLPFSLCFLFRKDWFGKKDPASPKACRTKKQLLLIRDKVCTRSPYQQDEEQAKQTKNACPYVLRSLQQRNSDRRSNCNDCNSHTFPFIFYGFRENYRNNCYVGKNDQKPIFIGNPDKRYQKKVRNKNFKNCFHMCCI